jgi:hypothetical protein
LAKKKNASVREREEEEKTVVDAFTSVFVVVVILSSFSCFACLFARSRFFSVF